MVLDEMTTMYNPWNMLQQPVHSGYGNVASFGLLLAALDQGWQVEEPVQVLPAAGSDSWTYYFVLTHPTLLQACPLFVPSVLEVDRFIERNDYQVIEADVIVWRLNENIGQ
jgi:hypothetical protein